jgi:hypothetical protein
VTTATKFACAAGEPDDGKARPMNLNNDTTRIIRRNHPGHRLIDDDLDDIPDPEADKREAFNRGFNAGLDLAGALVAMDGDRKLAALIRRQRKVL